MRDKEEYTFGEGQIVFILHILFQQFSGTIPAPFPELQMPHEKLSFGCIQKYPCIKKKEDLKKEPRMKVWFCPVRKKALHKFHPPFF